LYRINLLISFLWDILLVLFSTFFNRYVFMGDLPQQVRTRQVPVA
jgi:hypothetical protein